MAVGDEEEIRRAFLARHPGLNIPAPEVDYLVDLEGHVYRRQSAPEGWHRTADAIPWDAASKLQGAMAVYVAKSVVGQPLYEDPRLVPPITGVTPLLDPLPVNQPSHAGVVVTLLAALAVVGVLVAVFATRHHSGTAASASAATGPASAVAGSASASASATAVKSATAQPPLEELIAIAEQDKTTVQGLAEHYWVPVLSSKKVGTVDPRDAEFPNRSYTNRMILENFNYWRSRYSSALLVQSSSYSSLVPGYWVIILNQPHSAPGDVISWCKAQGLNDDNCDATLLSNQLPNGPQTYQSW